MQMTMTYVQRSEASIMADAQFEQMQRDLIAKARAAREAFRTEVAETAREFGELRDIAKERIEENDGG